MAKTYYMECMNKVQHMQNSCFLSYTMNEVSSRVEKKCFHIRLEQMKV